MQKGTTMLGKLAGALIGKSVAGSNSGAKGALLGYGIAAIARRGIGPLAAAVAIAWGARKLYRDRDRFALAKSSNAKGK
jgi:hypothetical protein